MPRLSADARHTVRFTLNGRVVEGQAEPRMLLTDFLRHELGATGTHVGCEHGVCGACTVEIDGVPARSCLTLAVQADGATIRTRVAPASTMNGRAASFATVNWASPPERRTRRSAAEKRTSTREPSRSSTTEPSARRSRSLTRR